MPHIVAAQRSSLIMQMLLDGNLYVATSWCFSYLLFLIVYEWDQLKLSVLLVYALTVIIEGMRIYMGYVLNLSPNGPRSKLLLCSALAACLPIMCCSWYLYGDHSLWLRVIYNIWTAFIVIEMIAAAGIIWWRLTHIQQLPDWSALEANLKGRRRRSVPNKVYKL